MIGTRLRKIVGDVRSRKIRTVLVSFSIFIGVFGVVTLVSASNLLVDQLEKDINQDLLLMTRVIVTVRSGETIDNNALLETIRQLEGVTQAEARLVNSGYWRKDSNASFIQGSIVTHSEAYDASTIEPIRLVDGRFPTETGDTNTIEVAIERRFADKHAVGIGDTLELRLLAEASDGDPTNPSDDATVSDIVKATVVGLVFQPYGYQVGLEGGESDSLIFATEENAKRIAGASGFNLIYARYETFEQAETGFGEIQAVIRNNSAYIPVNASTSDPAKNDQIEQTRSTGQILVILALLALIVSGFLIVNVVSAIVSEQRRQIGIMKSLGASGFDTFFIYAGIAMTYGVIGAVPGVILGIPGGYFAAQALASVFNTVIEEFTVVPIAVGLGVILGLAVPLLASILPVFLGSRVTILEAITDLGIGSRFGQGRIEQWLGTLPLSLSVRQSINNAFQKKYRLMLTGITLVLANAAFMGIFSVFFGLSQLAGTTFDTFGYQIAVKPSEGQNFERVAAILEDNVASVKNVEPGVALSIDIQDFDAPPIVAGPPGINGTGFNTENPSVVKLNLIEGDGWDKDPLRDGVVIASRITDFLEVGVGDPITITAAGNTETYTIIGIANWPFYDVWFKWQDLARLGGLLEGDGATPYANAIDVILEEDEPSSDAVDTQIDTIQEVLLKNGISASYENVVASSELIVNIVVIFGVVLSLASLLIAAVGGVGLLSTLSISVFERQKEIGVMRSVGATSANVATQFVLEGAVVGIVSWIIAVPISLGIRQLLLAGLPFGDVFQISYPLITLVIGLVGMLVLVVVASLWPSISAARRTVSDILRYQ